VKITGQSLVHVNRLRDNQVVSLRSSPPKMSPHKQIFIIKIPVHDQIGEKGMWRSIVKFQKADIFTKENLV
jgi:hypothetical protein